MENQNTNPTQLPAVMELWRKPGADFDCAGRSSLGDLLALGGYFPLSKVEDRLPFSRNRLQQWAYGSCGGELASCFFPIRAKGRRRALTILVDLVRLNDFLSAQIEVRATARATE